MPEPDDCICEDPMHPGKYLWLCGSELCDKMKDAYFNFKPLKKIIICDDTPEEEPR